ncbi:hypothetical protein Q5425_29155 [Amycolatopsis sp. A133]|uniref:hypothetical protein n=1 Tax=Amycolatopsis sp. A133 TaxID=3064472 RepID=UPI0027E9C9B5|nr:hypothetical protein [Amycolatopsis sp. A133]MDQ7807824.1 hypothetical protein [Amycolatopsis sp. A133]
MGNKVRTALAGAAAVTAGAVAFAGASAAAGQSPAPAVQAGQVTCVTDGSGYCTVSHGLGVVPEAILVSAITPNAANGLLLSTVQGSATPTTFRVRAMASQATPKTNGRISFGYAAYAAAAMPDTPTPTDYPTPTVTADTPTPGTSPEPTPDFPTPTPSDGNS